MTLGKMSRRLSGTSALALTLGMVLGSTLFGGIAQAQTTPPSEEEETPAATTPQADGDDTEDAEIIVTGSLVARPDYSSTSPIVSVGEERIQESGGLTVESALNQLPQFVPNRNSTTNFPGFGRPNIQLRGLGPGRTLVLLNGRRFIGDVNSLPSAFINRIEVITGGASTAYGSDAVAGVVNVITGRQQDGLSVDLQGGITEHGDGRNFNASIAYSGDIGERGRILVGGMYQWRDTTLKRDRDFSRVSLQELSPTLPEGRFEHLGNLPSQAAVSSVFARYGVTSFVPRNLNFGVNTDGTLFTQNAPLINFRGTLDERYAFNQVGELSYNGSFFTPLDTPLDSYSLFAQADYELADWIEMYGQVNFTRYTASWGQGPGNAGAFLWNLSVPVTNPFIPQDLRTLLQSRPNPNANFAYVKRLEAQLPREVDITNDIFQAWTGLRGTIPGTNLSWDVYGSYGSNDNTEVNQSGNLQAIQRLLEAPDGGRSLCEGGYNPFGQQPVSASCAAFTSAREATFSKQTIFTVEGIVRGQLFRLLTDEPIRFAVGADYRRETLENIPGQLALANRLPNFAGQSAVSGEIDVKEVFAEVLVPLLHDLPLIERLDVGAGYRHSDYNLAGGVDAYRVDADWHVGAGLRLRGGYNRAVRAPTIQNLFAPVSNTAPNIGTPGSGLGGDPCDVRTSYRTGPNGAQVRQLCIAQGIPPTLIDTYTNSLSIVVGRGGGNPNLRPEIADTYTAGAVWRSSWDSPALRNLQLSVDYYRIDLRGAIGSIGATDALTRCYTAAFNPTFSPSNFYCTLINRAPSGQFNFISGNLQNTGGLKISGVDMQLDWRVPIGPGNFTLNAVWSYLRHFRRQNLPGEAFLDFAGTIGPRDTTRNEDARPTWKGVTTFGYDWGAFSANLRWRFIDAMRDQTSVINPTAVTIGTPTVHYFDLNMRYRLSEAIALRAGVINLGDRDPPFFTSANQANTDPATYDVLGRRFYAGATFEF